MRKHIIKLPGLTYNIKEPISIKISQVLNVIILTYPFLAALLASGESEGCPGSDSESIEILSGDLKLRNVKLSTESIEELNMNSVALVRHSLPVRL
jgi:hypothetical protein